ncbi:hypothetical protein FNF29_02554 [Cafeteria roenbergensis]|uniref:Uncharacterized protein n=1 Tax=Cafeteria roenbergensis TaxID=33653 RepID=A0A5A8CPF9_CAFRO|nr:hypothetical protein FNF29_02554 [Cafeteria roenbergensis]|eukprot:KAA0154334.1 hypothetical protein FNF29_02554 [Cafeteria roenbergensis]
MAMASTRGAGLSRVMARTHVLAAPGSARRGVISEALVADWVPTTGCLDDELVIEDGKGARVSPLHDVPTFARFRAIRHRFPTMFAGGRRPMIVNATTIGQRKSDSLLQVDVEKEGNPIRRTLAPMGNPDRLTVPCEADCLAIGQTMQPTLWQSSARAFGEAELDAFATIKGYAGGAYEAAAALDDAAEAVREAWEKDEDAVSSEPAASAAYPGYARQYGHEVALDAAKIAEDWPARASAHDEAVLKGLDQATADRLAARRAEAAAVAVARQRVQGATRAVEEAAGMGGAFEERGEDIIEAGAYGTAEAWRWGGGRMGSTGGPLTMLDLGMAASEPGTVRELAVLGAVAVLRATPCPLLNGDAPAPRNPLESWPAGADTFAGREMGRPADQLPTLTLDWVILGAGLPAFENGSSSADLDAKAVKRSGLGSQATADELLNDDNGAAIRDVLLADLESGAHDLASLYDPQEVVGGSAAPSWVPRDAEAAAEAAAAAAEQAAEEGSASAAEAAAHAAATAATRRTDRLLLQARVEALSQWLESCTLGLDHVPPCTVVRGPNGRPLVFGAAVAQALVFAHRAAWWRHAVARPFFTQDESPATGMDAILSLALPGANTPPHPAEGGWHPRTLTEPSPVAAAAALASLSANESSRDLFGSASQRLNDHSFLGSTDKGLFPRDPALAKVGPLGAGGVALDDMCIDRFVPAGSEPLEAWQEEAFTATLRKRMDKARLMEERPEPTIGHHDE